MKIIKNSAKQPMSFYSEILLDTTLLKKCDIALVEKALQLIKNLAEVDPEKAKMINDALKDYVNSFKKTMFQQTRDIVKCLFLLLSGLLLMGIGIAGLSLALLFFIPSLALAPIQALVCIGIAIAGLALLGISLLPMSAGGILLQKIIEPRGYLEKIIAELNPYYIKAKMDEVKQVTPVALAENNFAEINTQKPIASAFFRSSSPHRDNVLNEDDRQATYLNNLVLPTQLRK